MPRKKIEFTEEMNFRITQLVEINKSLQEIADDLEKNFGFKVHYQTVQKHIDKMGLDRIDGRKYSGNHSRGYAAVVESTKEKPISTYKLKKMDCGCLCTKEYAKNMGYDKNGLPSNFRLIKNKSGEIEEVELTITLDNIKFSGGEGCQKGSERWWMIERMRFDYGCKDRGLLEGQRKGDWRGVVKRFLYDENDYIRFDDFDIIQEQQEAWERYVDAAFDIVEDMNVNGVVTKRTNKADVNKSNEYIINNMSDKELIDLMEEGPEFIYRYIPTYLYSKVVCFCIDKMYEENRLSSDLLGVANTVKNIMGHTRGLYGITEVDKITFDVVKQCLFLNPNDYSIAVQRCCLSAINKGLVDKEYATTLFNLLFKLMFKYVDTKHTLNGVEWLSVIGPHKDDFHNAFYRKDIGIQKACERFGLTW